MAKDDAGDINLWGFEEPSIESHKQNQDKHIALIDKLQTKIVQKVENLEAEHFESLLSMMSTYISEIRNTELGHKRLLQQLFKLSINNPDKKTNYNFGMNAIKAYIYTTNEWIQCSLLNNRDICEMLSQIKGKCSTTMSSDVVTTNDLRNVRLLQNPVEIEDFIDLDANPMYIKQRTDKWFEVHTDSNVMYIVYSTSLHLFYCTLTHSNDYLYVY